MPDVGQWPEYSDKGKDSRKHLLAWTPVKEHRGGTRSISFVQTAGALHCMERNEFRMGAWCLHSWETNRICFLSMAWEGTVRSQNCKEGALKWAQTQCWGGWAVKDCHLQMIKLKLGAPDGFTKRRNAVLESNMKTRTESGRCARKCAQDGLKPDGP